MKRFLLIYFVISLFVSAQQGESLADKRLMKIVHDQQRLMAQAETGKDADDYVNTSSEPQIRQLAARWSRYINDHPKDVEARLLYGKFLRTFGESESAILEFLAADALEPELPVIKQQIGNYYAEHGLYEEALKAFIQAVELAPEESIYHYLLGEGLFRYRWQIIEDDIYTRATLDEQMSRAFGQAAQLAPEDLGLQMRYAESFYDLESPDWAKAALQLAHCASLAESHVHKQTVHLHQARVAAEMGELEIAKTHLDSVTMKALAKSEARVRAMIQARVEGN